MNDTFVTMDYFGLKQALHRYSKEHTHIYETQRIIHI